MMYFKFTIDYLSSLKNNLSKFFNDVLNEINRQERDGIAAAKREAEDDKQCQRYDYTSIDTWLYETISYLNTWAKDLKAELDSDYHRALNILEEVQNKKFYESDLGYKFNIKLYDGVISKTKSPNNVDQVFVSFTGITWNVDGTMFEFTPDDPEFTDWTND